MGGRQFSKGRGVRQNWACQKKPASGKCHWPYRGPVVPSGPHAWPGWPGSLLGAARPHLLRKEASMRTLVPATLTLALAFPVLGAAQEPGSVKEPNPKIAEVRFADGSVVR